MRLLIDRPINVADAGTIRQFMPGEIVDVPDDTAARLLRAAAARIPDGTDRGGTDRDGARREQGGAR